MPISIAKAAEILALNLFDRRTKMPPDVADSLALAIDALALIQHLRLGNSACVFEPLQHETGYTPPIFEQDHNHPATDGPAPQQPG
jgi:hypothetical protein